MQTSSEEPFMCAPAKKGSKEFGLSQHYGVPTVEHHRLFETTKTVDNINEKFRKTIFGVIQKPQTRKQKIQTRNYPAFKNSRQVTKTVKIRKNMEPGSKEGRNNLERLL